MQAINNSLPNAGGISYGSTNVASALDSLTTTVDGKITGSGIANNLTTTSTGYALDATQGKSLKDSLDTLTTTVSGKITGSGIANNLTTTTTGYALDATQGKTLKDSLDTLTTTVDGKITGTGIANNLTTTSSGYALDARQGKTLNDAIACSHLSISGWTGGSHITRLIGYMTKIGKFITITGSWEGSATNTQNIMIIPSAYRPSYDLASGGSGFIMFSSTNIASAEYSLWSNGNFRQATNISAATRGSFTISYHL